jgi:predicted metal-dependent HD superfamily phosphohydrolase
MPLSTEFLFHTWMQALDDRWQSLPERDLTQSTDLFHQLCTAYQSPTRHYHTLEHLQQMFKQLEFIQVHDNASVTLTIWFHDSVYETQASDNEEKSAQWAIDALSTLGLPTVKIDRIAQLIRMTQTHQANSDDRDAQVLLDCDLSILGTMPEEYDRYADAIRQEYAWVSDEEYRVGRSRVLQAFLDRDRLYQLPDFRSQESQARQNLTRELQMRLQMRC